jgi:hypothetical protein
LNVEDLEGKSNLIGQKEMAFNPIGIKFTRKFFNLPESPRTKMVYETYASFFPGLDKQRSIRFHAEDPLIVLVACVAFFLLRKLLSHFIFTPIADYLNLDKTRTSSQKNSKHSRFVEDIWYSTFYPLSTISMFLILRDKEWFWNPLLSVKGYGIYPHPHLSDEMFFKFF